MSVAPGHGVVRTPDEVRAGAWLHATAVASGAHGRGELQADMFLGARVNVATPAFSMHGGPRDPRAEVGVFGGVEAKIHATYTASGERVRASAQVDAQAGIWGNLGGGIALRPLQATETGHGGPYAIVGMSGDFGAGARVNANAEGSLALGGGLHLKAHVAGQGVAGAGGDFAAEGRLGPEGLHLSAEASAFAGLRAGGEAGVALTRTSRSTGEQKVIAGFTGRATALLGPGAYAAGNLSMGPGGIGGGFELGAAHGFGAGFGFHAQLNPWEAVKAVRDVGEAGALRAAGVAVHLGEYRGWDSAAGRPRNALPGVERIVRRKRAISAAPIRGGR